MKNIKRFIAPILSIMLITVIVGCSSQEKDIDHENMDPKEHEKMENENN